MQVGCVVTLAVGAAGAPGDAGRPPRTPADGVDRCPSATDAESPGRRPVPWAAAAEAGARAQEMRIVHGDRCGHQACK